jgi:epoxyqueuosine reductase
MPPSEPIPAVVRAFADDEGIPILGWTPVGPVEPESTHLREWLARGLEGPLSYLHVRLEMRTDPCHPLLLRGGARSAVLFGLPYDRRRPPPGAPGHDVAGYARGPGYFSVFRKTLRRLATRLRRADPGIAVRLFSDTAPIPEKALAIRAGLGFRGRNTLVIHPRHGSTFVLGGLLVDRDLPAPEPVAASCGTCRRCIDACPSGALSPDGFLDARRCLSTFTTGGRSIPPPPDLPRGSYAHGCDACQDACPFNAGEGPAPYAGFTRM